MGTFATLTCMLVSLLGGACDTTGTEALPPPPPKVSFASQIQPIFDTHCIRCHVLGGFANQSGIPLKLVNGQSYDLLVNKSSAQRPDLTLVKPGDSASSLLYMKITQDPPPIGRHMPWDSGQIGSTIVSDDEKELIREWIDDGAPRS
jgi:hypothetical protein